MRILIATPAFGGLLTTKYLHGILASVYGAMEEPGLDLVVYTLRNESLVNRARNTCAAIAIENRFDRLMFIDSDIGWTWPDLRAIIRSEKRVVGGTYPRKNLPISLDYDLLPIHQRQTLGTLQPAEDHLRLKQLADPVTGELEVLHIPTGFMQIDVSVFHQLASTVPSYKNRTGGGEQPNQEMHDFFPLRVRNEIMESEDRAFCSICRENGIPVYLNTNVVLNHTGSYTFDVPR